MKILIISHEYPPVGGGGANACMNLAREYARKGNEVHIVTVWYENQKEEEILAHDADVYIYRLKSKRQYLDHCSFGEMLSFISKALPFANRLEKKEHFDICQIFFGIPSGTVGYYLKKKYNLPYVIRFGGGDIPGFQDRFKVVYKVISPFVKIIWNNANALVANSKGLKELALDFYNKKEIIVIPNGVDVRAFSCANDNGSSSSLQCGAENIAKIENNDEEEVKILFVSRLIERKGLQDIIPQLSKLDAVCKRNGKTIKLVIVGDGPYRETIEAMVRSFKLENLVSFEGYKSKQELPKYYSSADIFVFPSRKEGMPNVVLEAMSYGLPIIMTPCQGSDELIDGNGDVVSIDSFVDKIGELVLDENARDRMGKRSKNLIETEFSWNKVADSYLEIFKRNMNL